MARWAAFAGLTGVVLTLLLALARLSQSVVDDRPDGGRLASIHSTDDRRDRGPPDSARTTTADRPAGPDGRDAEVASGDVPDESAPDDAADDSEFGGFAPDDAEHAESGPGEDATEDAARADTIDDVAHTDTIDAPAHDHTTDAADASAGSVGVSPAARTRQSGQFSTGALLVNVALTQGAFGGVLLAGAWYFQIPWPAFGLGAAASTLPALAVGVGLGVVLYLANELGASVADAAGVEHDEQLRSMLAPESVVGWLVLLAVVLPIIAGVEEFIFRAAVVGAVSAGFGTSPWVLAVLSSLAFALGHGAQGTAGVVVTGALGFVLAAAFVLTGSFLVVFVAHYLVNALEFLVHEALGVESLV